MSQGIDLRKAEAALKRAGQRAIHGTQDERSGRLVFSTVTDARYNTESCELDVWFVSGRRYRYFNVPSHVYKGLINAGSKGTFFNAHIRPKYVYQLLSA
jgi:hypothetical protein